MAIQCYDLYQIMQHIRLPSSHGILDNWCLQCSKLRKTEMERKKIFNLINVMFHYVETRYVFRVPLHAKQIHGRS